jgi:hypothetical protein
MKPNNPVPFRRRNANAFDSSLVNLASLAGLPISRSRRRSHDGDHITEGVTIDMTAFSNGLSKLLREVTQS